MRIDGKTLYTINNILKYFILQLYYFFSNKITKYNAFTNANTYIKGPCMVFNIISSKGLYYPCGGNVSENILSEKTSFLH